MEKDYQDIVDSMVTLTLTQDGKDVDQEFVIAAVFDCQGQPYAGLVPQEEMEKEDGDIYFYRLSGSPEDPDFDYIDDDEEYDAVVDAFDEFLDDEDYIDIVDSFDEYLGDSEE